MYKVYKSQSIRDSKKRRRGHYGYILAYVLAYLHTYGYYFGALVLAQCFTGAFYMHTYIAYRHTHMLLYAHIYAYRFSFSPFHFIELQIIEAERPHSRFSSHDLNAVALPKA